MEMYKLVIIVGALVVANYLLWFITKEYEGDD